MNSTEKIMHICVADEAEKQAERTGRKYVMMPFYRDGKPFAGTGIPRWGMSLRGAGSMRFRWTENNINRDVFLKYLFEQVGLTAVSLELIHSKTVIAVFSPSDTALQTADGMIMLDKSLVPVITVADCMPVYLFDPITGVFGALHSGWKGTGIAAAALEKAHSMYGTDPSNVCAALGPHIHECCYIVDRERADYFRQNFCEDCITPVTEEEIRNTCAVPDWNTSGKKLFRLSLEKANIQLLLKAGVRPENIVAASDCTCCNTLFGSFRRETAGLTPDAPLREKWQHFTIQAAFCGYF